MSTKLYVTFTNGSLARLDCASYAEAYESANQLSFSGGKISRVEIFTDGMLGRALWDKDWTEESKAAGLKMPR